MNPVLMFCYNNLELTKAAVESVLNQDIPVRLYLINNGSSDGTREWLEDLIVFCPEVKAFHLDENRPPTHIVNEYLPWLIQIHGYVLGVPNDVRLPRNCYSEMLKCPRGFVSASDNGHNEPFERAAAAVSECTPFAVMLTRKWAYDAIVAHSGYFFDEGFVHYASDCDMALRMAACGVRGVQLDIPFWHYGSATWRLTTDEERAKMLRQADLDREYFFQKWGFRVEDPQYQLSAQDINFRGIPSTGTPQRPAGDMSTGEPEHTR